MLTRKVVTYEPVDLKPGELITITEAAKLLGMTRTGVISALNRCALTEIINQGAAYHDRRRLVRAEIMRMVAERQGGDGLQ